MGLKLNGATSGSIELDPQADLGSDRVITLNATGNSTLTLPDSNGTLDRLERAGNILQVVNSNTSTAVINGLSSYIDTNLTATIAPTSASSKILILVNQTGLFKNAADTWLLLKLFRNATDLSTFGAVVGYNGSTAENNLGACSCCFLDSPNTTSSTTYSTKFANQTAAGNVGVQRNGSVSTITLLEVSA